MAKIELTANESLVLIDFLIRFHDKKIEIRNKEMLKQIAEMG